MIHNDQPRPCDATTDRLAPAIEAGLLLLAEARDYGRDTRCDSWQFALEIGGLQAVGLTASSLRWLLSRGWIEHAREVTRPEDGERRFMLSQNMAFDPTTCFVLTETGASFASALRTRSDAFSLAVVFAPESEPKPGSIRLLDDSARMGFGTARTASRPTGRQALSRSIRRTRR